MKPPITPNQVNLELSDDLSYIMNKGEIKRTATVKAETKKTETVRKNEHFLQLTTCYRSSVSSVYTFHFQAHLCLNSVVKLKVQHT